MKKSDIEIISSRYNLAPNKKLGQNFLLDEHMVAKLIRLVDPSPDDSILEIGPGLGALTGELLKTSGRLTVVEIDSGFCRYLGDTLPGDDGLKIIHGDFLKILSGDLPGPFTKTVSNLPYYCASEILFRIARELRPQDVYVMMQKEMGDRLAATPGSKSYGAMTVSLGYYYRIEASIAVKRESFYPRPDVASVFLHLSRRRESDLQENELEYFHDLVKSAFWGRRKTLLKSLSDSPHMDLTRDTVRALLDKCHIEERKRGEELHLEEYITMARTLNRMK